MKNSLSSPKKVSVLHRYAPLLQGGWGKLILLGFIILLCAFTMSKFAHVHLQAFQGIVSKEILDNTGNLFGALLGAGTITHFAATFILVARDCICYFKKDAGGSHYLREKVNISVFVLNLITCIGIMAFDGYVSLVGIKEAVEDMGAAMASDKYTAETTRVENNYTSETATYWQSWRTDSANIEKKYNSEIETQKSRAHGEIGDLKGKAARGAAAGSTSWAASLRGQASSKEAQLASKIAKIEAEKAQKLLDRSEMRDNDVRQKSGEKSNKQGLSLKEKEGTENKYKGFASKTWIFSLALYILYMVTVVKHELIHIEAGIENEVQFQESYFRTGFVQNLKHELGEWAHDVGRVITCKLADWRQGLRKKAVFRNLPLDAGDVYRQSAHFSAPATVIASNEPPTFEEENQPQPYRQTGNIGFVLPQKENKNEVSPLPQAQAQNIKEETLEDGKVKLTAFFETVPPYEQVFESKAEAEAWKRHIHPVVPMQEKAVKSANLKRELEQMRLKPQTPPPPVPPKITEVAAPCENVITSSDLRVRKASNPTVITKGGTVITENEPVITEGMLKNMSKAALSFTLSGIKKMESEAKSRAKRGEITPGTYQKKMQRVSEGKSLITKTLGQTEMQFI